VMAMWLCGYVAMWLCGYLRDQGVVFLPRCAISRDYLAQMPNGFFIQSLLPPPSRLQSLVLSQPILLLLCFIRFLGLGEPVGLLDNRSSHTW